MTQSVPTNIRHRIIADLGKSGSLRRQGKLPDKKFSGSMHFILIVLVAIVNLQLLHNYLITGFLSPEINIFTRAENWSTLFSFSFPRQLEFRF